MSLELGDVKGAAYARWSGRAEAGGESCVCHFGIEVVGVEVFTQPLTSLGVLGMSRIGEDFEQLTVAPGAAAILGWTPALSGGADGTGQSPHPSPHFSAARAGLKRSAFATASAK